MFDRIKRPLAGSLGCIGALILLTFLAYESQSFGQFDARVLNRRTAYKGTALGRVANFFVHLGDPLPQLALMALACLRGLSCGRRRQVIGALVLVGGANLTTQFLKQSLEHQRYQPILGYGQIGPTSFPSGHSTAAMGMALAFVLVLPRSPSPAVALLGAGFVLPVSYSIVVVHNHYPSDVLGGWLVATGWGFVVCAGLRSVELLVSNQKAQIAE